MMKMEVLSQCCYVLCGSPAYAIFGGSATVGTSPDSIVTEICSDPNCIILAISPANQDIATSDAIKLAREVDPTGERTFGVLRKLDLVDKGTNALDHLETVIRQRRPSIIALINKTIDELNAELDRIGRPIAVDSGAQLYTIVELCRAFDRVFKEHLDGGRPGGDRIYGVFDHQLPAALKKLPLDRHLSLKNVQKVVSEADGYQPHLIAPEQGYRRLIDGSISYFKGPAEASVDASQENNDPFLGFILCPQKYGKGDKRCALCFVLKELVRKSIAETEELKRFPTLTAEIAAAANEALERFRDESRKTVLRLVDMESSYLTVEFFRKLHLEPEKTTNQNPNQPGPNADRYSDNHFRRIRVVTCGI
ncbi:Dynamin- protein 1C [Turnera subulata]|uniref:Dynamin- protein 1C n=1 Tax=Turnera subulata TaxID=218843 RepID=A0A9Q0FYA5_9ROSI|nr:Dynamin- protein 1C [Turnera subulata]